MDAVQDAAGDNGDPKARSQSIVGWAAQGWRAFFGVGSVLAAANLVAHHGFRWNGYLFELVGWYRGLFIPFFENVLRPVLAPLFRLLSLRLTPAWYDGVTLFLIGLGAANAESVARHGRPAIVQLYMHAFAGGLDDGRPRSFLGIGINADDKIDELTWTVLPAFGLSVILTLFAAGLFFGKVMHLSLWASVALAAVSAIALLLVTGWLSQDVLPRLIVRASGIGKVVLRTVEAIVSIPLMSGFVVVALLTLLASPLLAWRTSLICCGLFAALATLNMFIPA